MKRTRQFAILASGFGIAAALIGAPFAGADEDGGGGSSNPLIPVCSAGTDGGGEDTECASPGSSELSFSPNSLGVEGAEIDEPMFGIGGI